MTAIKNWFLEKNKMNNFYGKELTIEKETEKAAYVSYEIQNGRIKMTVKNWIPKSCLCDEWEPKREPKKTKKNIHFEYHDYLVNKYHEAYNKQIIPNRTIESGRNRYRGDNFIHQETTKSLIEALNSYGIEFMTKEEFAKTL